MYEGSSNEVILTNPSLSEVISLAPKPPAGDARHPPAARRGCWAQWRQSQAFSANFGQEGLWHHQGASERSEVL